MNELGLFAGGGGGLLATKWLLGFKTVCYVEWEDYCIQVLKQRIADGLLDDAPIWDDAQTFDGRPWAGCVDIVTAGFPCSAFSSAPHGRSTATDLWPEVLRITREVKPSYVLAENVSRRAVDRACDDLESLGYQAWAISLSAKDLGADHIRRRYWLLAHPDVYGELCSTEHAETSKLSQFRCGVWKTGAEELRVVDGMAHRVDRLKAIGQGQVPSVVAAVWRLLTEGGVLTITPQCGKMNVM